MSRPILLCTVGTSLIYPNLAGLRKSIADDANKPEEKRAFKPAILPAVQKLADAYDQKDWQAVGDALAEIPSSERLCGAEVNSIHSLIQHNYAPKDCGIYFLHSDTDDGRNIVQALTRLFTLKGHSPVRGLPVTDLQDQDPKRFRTKGLRNLAKVLCGKIREHSASACAINATGGYKAQIAVGVLLGQSLGVPVYYMHERFSEIIAFPPMPVALDFEFWMEHSGLLQQLDKDFIKKADFAENWSEKLETLVDQEVENGTEYICLSATGQIFHETFRERFRSQKDQVLPPPAQKKLEPVLHDHGVIKKLEAELLRYLNAVTQEVPCVTRCVTNYCNPDLPARNLFRRSADHIEGIYSDGSQTVKFRVETTAQTKGQQNAAIAALNEWLESR